MGVSTCPTPPPPPPPPKDPCEVIDDPRFPSSKADKISAHGNQKVTLVPKLRPFGKKKL